MARISTYGNDSSIQDQDLLTGSNFITPGNYTTKNFRLIDLAEYFGNFITFDGTAFNLSSIAQQLETNTTDIAATSAYGVKLATTFGTFDDLGNLITLSQSFANDIITTTSNARFAESSYVTALQSNFGTFDGSGSLVSVSEAFANNVITTTSSNKFATSESLTSLDTTVTAQGVSIGGLSTSIAAANQSITTNSTAIESNSTATTNLTAVVELKPLTFRQDNPPSVTEPVGSIWFDTNDSNKIYILVDGTPNVWTPTFDGRVAVNTTAISNANQTISANTTAHEANASSILNLSSTVTANKTEQDNLPAIFRQDDEPATTHPLNSLWYDTNDGNKLYVMITTAGTKSWAPTQDLGLNTLISGNATSIGNNATGISNNSTAISNNLTSIGLTPKVFRQNAPPAVTEPVSSIWYDTDDDNKPYVLVAGSPNVWTLTVDPRMGATVQGLANAVSDISTNSDTISANALKREELEAVFSFDSNTPAQITGVAGALNTSINNAASSAVQATANSLDKLEAVFSFDSNNDVDGISGALSSAVTTHAGTAITNASLAAAADVTELQTQFSFDGSVIDGVADTLSSVINTAQSDAESASATKIDSLAANFFTGYDNADGTFTGVSVSEAFADEVIDATASARFATTTSQDTLAARVDDNEGDITENQTVAARVDGFVKSSYGLQANANGVVTGMQIVAQDNGINDISEVVFQADRFAIKGSTTNLTPFDVSGDTVQINGNLNVAGTAEIKGSSNTGQFIACDFKNTGSSGLSSIRVLNNTNYYGIFRLNTTVENDIGYYGIDLVIGPDTGGNEKKLVNFNGGGISIGNSGSKIFFFDDFAGNATDTKTGAIGVRGSSDGQATQAMFVTVPTNQANTTPAFAIESNTSNSLFKVFKTGHVETASLQTSGNITASGNIDAAGNNVKTASVNADVKFSVWGSSGTTYGIGMTSGVTLGDLDDFAMTFCMNNEPDRGFWWGHSGQSKSAGAMSLTTNGRLYVSTHIIAPIYYDTDTTYYLNPAGTSNLNAAQFAGAIVSDSTIKGTKFIDKNDDAYYLDPAGTSNLNAAEFAGTITSDSTIKGTQFIDKNNTGYYLDPAGTSNLNAATFAGNIVSNGTIKGTQFIDKNDDTYYLDPHATSNLNAVTLVGTFKGQNGYFAQDLGVGFNSGSIGGRINLRRSSAGIGIKNDYGTAASGTTGLLGYTDAGMLTSGAYHLVFQADDGLGLNGAASISNMLLCNLNGNLRNFNNSYGSTSDERLKENITDATPKLEDIKQLKVKNFNFIGNELKQIGLIAQEVEQIFPGLVEETIDPGPGGTEGEVAYKSIKYSVLVPMLIKAIQELEARVATLEG